MIYLNSRNLEEIGRDWASNIEAVRRACGSLAEGDFAQPVKPYLRYRDLRNRIIAMPAFLGGQFNIAGIKWISSFPGNLKLSIQRAHSVVILNDADTGKPLAVINSGALSAIRTAAVSGLMLESWLKRREPQRPLIVGMTGFGPIGQMHLEMLKSVLGARFGEFRLFDLAGVSNERIQNVGNVKARVVGTWQDAYREADIFVTCTVSSARYINEVPPAGSLQLNVSLRDYEPEVVVSSSIQVVDDWTEVCRENTDVEAAHRKLGLAEETCIRLDRYLDSTVTATPDGPATFFHPMGMAVFDLAIASRYLELARERGVGTRLED